MCSSDLDAKVEYGIFALTMLEVRLPDECGPPALVAQPADECRRVDRQGAIVENHTVS